jgi:hypothetical protein
MAHFSAGGSPKTGPKLQKPNKEAQSLLLCAFSFQERKINMAHNLLIQNGNASMFCIDEVPWHSLGVKLGPPYRGESSNSLFATANFIFFGWF